MPSSPDAATRAAGPAAEPMIADSTTYYRGMCRKRIGLRARVLIKRLCSRPHR